MVKTHEKEIKSIKFVYSTNNWGRKIQKTAFENIHSEMKEVVMSKQTVFIFNL